MQTLASLGVQGRNKIFFTTDFLTGLLNFWTWASQGGALSRWGGGGGGGGGGGNFANPPPPPLPLPPYKRL